VVISKNEAARVELSAVLGINLPMPKNRLDFRRTIKELTGERGDLQQLESLELLERLQQLESLELLERLQQLESLEHLNISCNDYTKIKIKSGSVIYCDPPYAGTAEYKDGVFDSIAFWQWCREQKSPVFVSEYSAPADFAIVAEFEHRSTLSSTNNAKVTIEKLFWNGRNLQ
jgi:16S rRNA G966 N2-methylase RsmD